MHIRPEDIGNPGVAGKQISHGRRKVAEIAGWGKQRIPSFLVRALERVCQKYGTAGTFDLAVAAWDGGVRGHGICAGTASDEAVVDSVTDKIEDGIAPQIVIGVPLENGCSIFGSLISRAKKITRSRISSCNH